MLLLFSANAFPVSFTANNIAGDTLYSFENCVADFNKDGNLDIYVANYYNNQNRLYLGNGDGTFSNKDITNDKGYSVGCAVGDVNGDGNPDIHVSDWGGQNALWLNDGNANFTSADITGDVGNSNGSEMGDLDGDGDLDIYVANEGQQNVLWINNGAGIFTASNISGDTGDTYGVVLGDVNSDTHLDIYVTNHGGEQNILWINDGLGNGGSSFSSSNISGDTGDSEVPSMADVDNDGDLDIYVPNVAGEQNKLWINNGSGAFTASDISNDLGYSVFGAFGDVDNDGDIDLYVTNENQQNYLYINDGLKNGGSSFSATTISTDQGNSQWASFFDADKDGDLDLYVTNFGNKAQNKLWMNNLDPVGAGVASAANTVISVSSSSVGAGGNATITVQAIDSLGNNLSTGGDTVVLFEDGNATISSPITDNNNGTYTATITNTTAETITITGTINSETITDTASISFTPGTATTGQTTINVSSTNVTADGVASATITVQTKDQYGNNLTSDTATIALSQDGSASISNGGAASYAGNGAYTATITSTTAESNLTISGTLDASGITDTATISFTAGTTPDASNTTLAASPTSLTANGSSASTITIQAKDNTNNNITSGGATVILSTTGSAQIGTISDNGNGTYTASVTNTVAESVTVSGSINGSNITSGDANITFNPGPADISQTAITVSPNSISADGIATATISVQTKDAFGNNLTTDTATIALTQNGSASIGAVSYSGAGIYTADISSTVAETITVSGTLNSNPISDNATITFQPGAAIAGNSTLSISKTSVNADGISTVTITVNAIDAQGNQLTSGGDSVVINASGSATISAVTDQGVGIYTATVTNTTAETVTISGTLNAGALSNTADITFNPASASANTTMSLSPGSAIADGSSGITVLVQAKDSLNNNLSSGGDTVLLSQNGSATISAITDNGDGTYSAILTNLKVESVTISGTINGIALGNNLSATFVPGPVSESHSLVTASPSTVEANGTSEATVTILKRDSNNNALTSGGSTVSVSSTGSATVSLVTDHGDGSYTATITNSIVEDVTVSVTIDGVPLTNTATIKFVSGIADLNHSSLSASTSSLPADGTATSLITLQAADALGNALNTSAGTVTFSVTGSAQLSPVTDNNNGTYQATLTSSTAETVTVSAQLNNEPLAQTLGITFTPGAPSISASTISATPSILVANGVTSALITVRLKDETGNHLINGNADVNIISTGSAIVSQVTNHDDGSYSASITNTVAESVLVNATINGVAMTNHVTVTFVTHGSVTPKPTDGQFVQGSTDPGAEVIIENSMGVELCITLADAVTGEFHCRISSPIADSETLTVISINEHDNITSKTITVTAVDTDNDGTSDVMEDLLGTNKFVADKFVRVDSDLDQIPDYHEIIFGSDRFSANDPVNQGMQDDDSDGISNALSYYLSEVSGNSDPEMSTDTDRDGIADITELQIRNGNVMNASLPIVEGHLDQDGDQVTDAVEYYLGTLYIESVDNQSDYDRDGYGDALEVRLGSNPLKANDKDADFDGVNDAVEAFLTGTINDGFNTAQLDSDADGLADIYELSLQTDRFNPLAAVNNSDRGDADEDGITDAIEKYLTGNTDDTSDESDTDRDGITDLIELSLGSNPFVDSTPVIWINVKQTDANTVEATAMLGGYQAPLPEFMWETNAIINKNPEAVISTPNARQIIISGLQATSYKLGLKANRHFAGNTLSSEVERQFLLKEIMSEDNDNDGIEDGYDHYDGLQGQEETLQSVYSSDDQYRVMSETGTEISLGSLATLTANKMAQITEAQLNEFINGQTLTTKEEIIHPQNASEFLNIFDFEIANLPRVGAAVSTVIPLNYPATDNATLLLFNADNRQWSFFETSRDNAIKTATGSSGICPAIADRVYETGIAESSHCLQLTITDGGANDLDGQRNGHISVMAALGTRSNLSQSNGVVSASDAMASIALDKTLFNYQVNHLASTHPTDQNEASNQKTGGGSMPLLLLLVLGAIISTRGNWTTRIHRQKKYGC